MMTYKINSRRYTGSKARLANWIMSLIHNECEGEIFADIFAGTGIVAAAAAASNSFTHIIVNDLLYSNYIIYKAFFEKSSWNKKKLETFIEKYNAINPKRLKDNYFSKNFGGKYFSKDVAKVIGYIRDNIERNRKNITDKEYFILLASLIYSIDRISNTVGHYDAYIRKTPRECKLIIKLIEQQKVNKIDIYRTDTNELAKKIKADVVYIDPPYNSRQYSRFYHLYETLVKWDKPKLYGVALKPEPENMSDYCRVAAPKKFNDLVNNLDCKYIVVSYNNTYNSKSKSSKNKIELNEIKNMLEARGKTKVFKKNHRYFTTGKTEFNNHKEYIFIAKINNNNGN